MMDNIILKGMLKDFVSKFELENNSTEIQFEKFLNYCLLNEDYYDSFEFDKVCTGECIGIDGIAIIIGGVIINDIDNADLFTKGQFDVKFVFTQAKTSQKFNFGDFLKFVSTVKVYFGDNERAIPPELKKAYEIKKLIYSKASKLRSLPILHLVYGYTGKFDLEATGLKSQIEQEIDEIRKIPYHFSSVKWKVCDGEDIENLYREAQNEVQHKISFQRHIALPPINGVKSTYLGVIKCKDFVSLITKKDKDINKGVFLGNVRDFLGDKNQVNAEIEKTLESIDEKDRFAILNNGVTIVAKKVTPSGDTFELSQFQIVNGCQTSHVLFNNSNLLTEDMYLTVKLIETSDLDISGSIIATTNSQSQVTKEAFATIRPYHRRLEDFFKSLRDSGYMYYYERRPHQYDELDNIKQKQIASAPVLIKSYISVVLEEPHKVHYYYGQLLYEYNSNETNELFSESDHPGLYFLSHHIVSKCREKISTNGNLKKWMFHIALLVKKLIASDLVKGQKITDKKFLEILSHIDSSFDSAYINAVLIIKELDPNHNTNRLPATTDSLIEKLYKSTRTKIDNNFKSNVIGLSDGQYEGKVTHINIEDNSFRVKYGPFEFLFKKNDDFFQAISLNNTFKFSIKDGTTSFA
jgi:hypothetical protein